MKNLIKVEGHKDLYRNESGAIVNMNKTALERAKARKEKIEKEKQEFDELKSEVPTPLKKGVAIDVNAAPQVILP